MCMTYYTVDDLRPGRSGWGVKRFSALNDAISHYRSLPMDGARVLGMADDAHAYELIRCVRLFPGDAQGEDVLAADHWRDGLTKKNAALKDALDICLESLRPRFLLEPERLIPIPQHKKPRKELREALLWQGYMTQSRPEPKVIVIPAKEESPQDQEKKKNLRVAAYCRVSTKKDEQLNSYENQKAYYTEKIMANPDWTMADIFADEGARISCA